MKIGRNDPCYCGSKKKYKHCCINKKDFSSKERNQLAKVSNLSLKQRNIILLNAVYDIFEFKGGVTWEKIKKSISGEQIKYLYHVIMALWPIDTDFESIIPPNTNKLRALYLGEVQPELIIENVLRISLYTDEIFIIDPFINPWCVAREYNPIEKPNSFKADTLKLLYFILMLEPWILSDIVSIIPDPGNFDYDLRVNTWNMAKNRIGDIKYTPDDIKFAEKKSDDIFKQYYFNMSDDVIKADMKDFDESFTDEQLDGFIDYVKREKKRNPIILDMPVEDIGEQMEIFRTGANLEMAIYISQIINAFPFTNMQFKWNEILSTAEEFPDQSKTWSPLTNAFQELKFKFLNRLDSRFACDLRTNGRLESFRVFLRKLWSTVEGEPNIETIHTKSLEFKDELHHEYITAKSEWDSIDRELVKWTGTVFGGAILSGKFAFGLPTLGFGILGITRLINSKLKRREFRKKVPMSIFIDLDNK